MPFAKLCVRVRYVLHGSKGSQRLARDNEVSQLATVYWNKIVHTLSLISMMWSQCCHPCSTSDPVTSCMSSTRSGSTQMSSGHFFLDVLTSVCINYALKQGPQSMKTDMFDGISFLACSVYHNITWGFRLPTNNQINLNSDFHCVIII